MSSANMKLAVLRVPVPESDTGPDGRPPSPKQKLEPGEHIVRRVVELSKLKAELDGETKRTFLFSFLFSFLDTPLATLADTCL